MRSHMFTYTLPVIVQEIKTPEQVTQEKDVFPGTKDCPRAHGEGTYGSERQETAH